MNEITTAHCAECDTLLPTLRPEQGEEVMPVCESCKVALLAEDAAARLDPRNFDPEYLKSPRSWEFCAW